MTSWFKNTVALAMFGGLLFFSCNQDSIFFDISKEIEPKDPRIAGSPTNIVERSGALYAASIGSSVIHQYAGGWSVPYSVPGAIQELAATSNKLYAITSNTLYRLDGGSVPLGGWLQTVYGAGDRVFVGIGTDPYSVVCYDDSDFPGTPVSLTGDPISGLLKGAAYAGANYYIVTTSGFYKIEPSGPPLNKVTALKTGEHFMGIIHVEDYILAITRNGKLYYYKYASPPADVPSHSVGGDYYTGAMGGWSPSGAPGSETHLLLGVYSSTAGYREVGLDSDGKPGGGATLPSATVRDMAKYQASIEKHPVYSIRQVPGEPSVIFATTYKDGLWSLRGDEWNAEE
jgi:hypothetical protein